MQTDTPEERLNRLEANTQQLQADIMIWFTGGTMSSGQTVPSYMSLVDGQKGIVTELTTVLAKADLCIKQNQDGIANNEQTMQNALNQVTAELTKIKEQASQDREILRKVGTEMEAGVKATGAGLQAQHQQVVEEATKKSQEMESNAQTIKGQTEAAVIQIHQRVQQMEAIMGKLEQMTDADAEAIRKEIASKAGAGSTGMRQREISEYKVISNLDKIPDDRMHWNWWVDKFKGALVQTQDLSGKTFWMPSMPSRSRRISRS